MLAHSKSVTHKLVLIDWVNREVMIYSALVVLSMALLNIWPFPLKRDTGCFISYYYINASRKEQKFWLIITFLAVRMKIEQLVAKRIVF